jgi:hypothetical protein
VSFRTDLLAVAADLRQLPEDEFDIRITSVVRRLRTWSSGEIGSGVPTNSDLAIDPRPKVVKLAGERFKVGPITPTFPGGGYTYAQLNPSDSPGVDFVYVLTGPSGAEETCALMRIDDRKAFSWYLELQSTDRAEPS